MPNKNKKNPEKFMNACTRMISSLFIRKLYKTLLQSTLLLLLVQTTAWPDEKTSFIQTLRLGIIPDSDKSLIDRRFGPLVSYLQQETGFKTELVIPDNYLELLQLFKEKKIDLALFGGYIFILAQQQANARPLVMRDIDMHFSSVFMAHPSNKKKRLEEFQGARFAFGSKQSTSGHLMPRYFLSERNIDPESFFSEVLYSGNHDKTAYWVRDGKVDLGAANSVVIRKMFRQKILKPGDIQILWETPVYTAYIWAIQPTMSKAVQNRLMDSFLALSPVDPEHLKILNALGTKGFLPANDEDFRSLRKIILRFQQEMK